jgi:TetR/AcrR family transcriptional regulator, transcriptional repressor for nem operon
MPWPEEHKRETRDRIVKAAAAALRAHGVDGVSIAAIMADVGLTHGGFYAHFASKDELLSAAVDRASAETTDHLSRAMQTMPADQRLRAVIDTYLSAPHAAHPEHGCPLAALGPELTRASSDVQRDLAQAIDRRIAWLQKLLPPEREAKETATAVMACMLGGLILARAVGPDDGPEVLAATRSFIARALASDTSDT